MKLAILIGGLPRCYKKMFTWLNIYFLNKYDCDIFISTWNEEYIKSTPYNLNYNYDRENLLELFKPKIFHEINFSEWYTKTIIDINKYKLRNNLSNESRITNGLFAHWYQTKCVYNIYEQHLHANNISYNFILKFRFDVIFDVNKLNFNTISPSSVYFLEKKTFKNSIIGLNDLIIIGTPDCKINIILNLYDYFINMNVVNKDIVATNSRGSYCINEAILFNYCNDNKIKYNLLNIKNYTLQR